MRFTGLFFFFNMILGSTKSWLTNRLLDCDNFKKHAFRIMCDFFFLASHKISAKYLFFTKRMRSSTLTGTAFAYQQFSRNAAE